MTTKPTNPFNYSKDTELYRIFDNLVSLKDKVQNQFEKAERIAGLGSVTGFEKLKNVELKLPNYRYDRTNQSSWRKTPLAFIDTSVRAAITEARQQISEAEEENKEKEENNKQLISQIIELMNRIGIPAQYTTYDYPSSRSRNKKSINHVAGYMGDLERVRPKSNLSSEKYKLENYIREYESWLKSEKDAELKEKIERDDAAVQKNILGNPTLVATLMQAGVNILEEVQKAVPGQKAEVINFCKAQAISNIKAMPEPDLDLIAKIQDL